MLEGEVTSWVRALLRIRDWHIARDGGDDDDDDDDDESIANKRVTIRKKYLALFTR